MKSQSIALNLLSFKSQNKDKGSDIKKDSFDRVLNEVRNTINNNTKNIKTSIDNREIKNTNHTTQEQAKDDVNNSKKTESEYKLNTSDAKEKEINNKFENKKDIIEDENKKNNLVQTYDALVELLNLLNLINLNVLKDTNQNDIDFISLNDLEISLKNVTKNLETIKSKLDLELTSNIDFNNQDILKIDSELKEIINHFSILFDFKNLTINKEELQNLKNILANNFNNNSFNENNSINFDLDNENVENSATLDELMVKILKVKDKLQKVLDDNNQNPQKIDATINSTVNKTTNVNKTANVIININIANTNDSLFTLLNNETSDESQRKNSNESINNQSNFSNIIQISNKINLQNFKETQISQIQKTDIIQKVADNIKIAVAKDLANVSISLKPESLGKIIIELTKDANGLIKGNIIVQSNEVKEVVSSSLNNLVSMLKDQGINISGLNVGLNQQSQNQNSFMQKRYKPTKQIETTPGNIDSIFYGIEEGYFSMKAWGEIMEVNNVTQSSSTTLTSSTSKTLGKQDFLNLLVTQLRYQDPLKPMEDKEFVAQLAQFSSLEQMQNMNQNMQLLRAQTLIGKNVTASISDGTTTKQIQGTVDTVRIEGENVLLNVNGSEVKLTDITNINQSSDSNTIINKLNEIYEKIPTKQDLTEIFNNLFGGK